MIASPKLNDEDVKEIILIFVEIVSALLVVLFGVRAFADTVGTDCSHVCAF